jgi:hypothetical protein
MPLPIDPNTLPMEARSVPVLPSGTGWRYEPRRCTFDQLPKGEGGALALPDRAA